jgi:hypothetical protein
VYYDTYLAAQNGEQDEESIAEQHKDLIQSQNGEQGEESIAEQVQDLLESQKSDLDEEDVQFSVDQLGNQAGVPASDVIDELGL